MDSTTFFSDVNELVEHLYSVFGEFSPLKLQKTLYFLFAFYSGMYSQDEAEGVVEQEYNFPNRLFNARFEAWTYGPVIPTVYSHRKYTGYEPNKYDFDEENPIDNEVKKFIEEVGEQIISKSDFSLVDRSHEDYAWRNAYKQGTSTEMSLEEIEAEYKEYFRNEE